MWTAIWTLWFVAGAWSVYQFWKASDDVNDELEETFEDYDEDIPIAALIVTLLAIFFGGFISAFVVVKFINDEDDE